MQVLNLLRDGEIDRARRLAEEERRLALSPERRQIWNDWIGLSLFWLGDFELALVFLADSTDYRGLNVVAAIQALRGESEEAERTFERVLAMALATGHRLTEASIRVHRAEFLATRNPALAIEDARRAQVIAAEEGDEKWLSAARHAEGMALGVSGDPESAIEAMRQWASGYGGPLDRAVRQTTFAEMLVRAGRRSEARTQLEEAFPVFERARARYWLARAALGRAACDRDRGGRWLHLARSYADSDPAFQRLFTPVDTLRLRIDAEPRLLRNDVPIPFLTRHSEYALCLLVMAGADGLDGSVLASTLWPDVDDDRRKSRLRTLLWQVRNSLGPDAWRIQRAGDRIKIDSSGIDVESGVGSDGLGTLLAHWGIDTGIATLLPREWAEMTYRAAG